MNIKEVKSRFRKQCLDLLKAQSSKDRLRKSELIHNKILELDTVKRISVIMTYVSDNYEVETHVLIRKLLEGGKRVVIPFLDERKNIVPCEIGDLDNDTEMSWYGCFEPKQAISHNPLHLNVLELVLVPGLAFNSEGRRLGRGWGCYDRFLSRLSPEIPTIGLAFDFQIRPDVPSAENDVVVSSVITN